MSRTTALASSNNRETRKSDDARTIDARLRPRQHHSMVSLLAQVRDTVRRHRMVTPGDRLLVACSGGPDSLVLLHVLRELAPALDVRLRAVYVDHGLRAAARREGARVVAEAERLGLHGEVVAIHLRTRSMEAAREARYQALGETARARGASRIALAHTRSDQAETVLMRLLRGAGLRGLA